MKVLFIITSHKTGAWLSEITHPYWHLTERGVEVDFASPDGGAVVWTPLSDPYGKDSQEPDDLVSKGFLGDKALTSRLENTTKLADVDLSGYDAVHVACGQGATYDLYPNEVVGQTLERFWEAGKIVGAICHGAISLGNVPGLASGRHVTGYSLEADRQLEDFFGPAFLLPHYPQVVLEQAGTHYSSQGPADPWVVTDGRLVTGQNQQSASEYALVLYHTLTGSAPIAHN